MSLGQKKDQSTQTQQIPPWLENAMQWNIDQGQALANRDYTAYEGQRQAGFDPMQEAAYNTANQYGNAAPDALGNAFGYYNDNSGLGMMSDAYGRMGAFADQAGNFSGMPGYEGSAGSRGRLTEADAVYGDRGNVANVDGGSFLGMDRDAYTNQFTQGVVDNVMSDMNRMNQLQQGQEAAQAAAGGAFGGSRHGVQDAILNSEAQRNFGQMSNQLNAQAFDAASGLMGQDLSRGFAADQFNAGQDSLFEQLNAGIGNANNQFNAANANNMSQFNAGQAQQNNQFNAGNQLMSDYYNMQGGLNNQSQMAGILASLGNMGQAIGNQTLAQGRANEGFGQSGMAAQEAAGNNVMGLDQANLTQMYNDFLEARDWSANNFQYANAGMPTQSAGGTTTQDVFSPGAGQQLLGAGTALGGAAIGKGGR